MAFTYDLTGTGRVGDIAFVRSEIQDTVEEGASFSDEAITFYLTRTSSPQETVIALLENRIALIASTPNFTADWLRVDATVQLAALRHLLSIKRSQYGIAAPGSAGTVSVILPRRADVRND